MKILALLSVLAALVACSAPARHAVLARLLEPSGLEQVSLLSKGLE